MAWVTVLTRWFELRVWVIRPEIGRFHACITILAISHSVSGNTLHPAHLTHTTARILNEEYLGLQLTDEFENVLIALVTELSIITYRSQIPILIAFTMLGYGCHTISRAVRTCPDDIWPTELLQNLSSSQSGNVDVQVDILE